MKSIEKIVTYDGVEHNDYLRAKRHLEEEFGRRVTALGHKFAPAGVSYKLFTSLIEQELATFGELIRIKNDMEFDKPKLGQFME